MKNIWKDGFEIERDGQKITLTSNEIREIQKAIDTWNGRGSIEYWLESMEEYSTYGDVSDTDKENMAIAEKMLEDENACWDVWTCFEDALFEDSGEQERWAVEDIICVYKNKENEKND